MTPDTGTLPPSSSPTTPTTIPEPAPRSAALRAFPGLATLALLGWLAVQIDLGAAWEAGRQLSPAALLGLIALSCAFNLGIYADRWRRALMALGIGHPLGRVLRVHLGTGALRLAMPIHTGEFVNAAVLARHGPGSVAQHVSTIAYLKFLNLVATGALAATGFAAGGFVGGEGTPAEVLLRTALACAVVLLPAFAPEIPLVRRGLSRLAGRIHPRVGDLLRDLLMVYREASLRAKLGLLAYSVLFQLSEVGVCHLLLRALGVEVAFTDTLLVAPLLMLVVSVPVSLAGVGVREASALVLLAPFAPEPTLLAFGLCYSLIEYIVPLAIGLPWLPGILSELAGGESVASARSPDS